MSDDFKSKVLELIDEQIRNIEETQKMLDNIVTEQVQVITRGLHEHAIEELRVLRTKVVNMPNYRS